MNERNQAPGPSKHLGPESANAGRGAPAGVVQGLAQVGIRALRNDVSALVRRAADGERIIVTVDGRPTAQLGPLQADGAGLTLEDLAAAGLIEAPRQPPEPGLPPPFPVPADVNLDRLVEQIRGR